MESVFLDRPPPPACPNTDSGLVSTLLVIAHPADEAMFFVPTIACSKLFSTLHLLCLSNGARLNFPSLGARRSQELLASCNLLGIAKSNVQIINDPRLEVLVR
jgi:LmbE family N-acetylglucosaminyl deacetylase